MSFLDHLSEVTARIRRGELPALDELYALKRENRRRAEEAEREDRQVCDSLPTWINTTNSTVCNLKCVFCNQAYGKGVDVKMEEGSTAAWWRSSTRRPRSSSSRPTASR